MTHSPEQKAAKNRQRRERRLHERRMAEMRRWVEGEAGRDLMWWLLNEKGGLMVATFNGNARDVFMAGRRSLALEFFEFVSEAYPEFLPQAFAECRKHQQIEALVDQSLNGDTTATPEEEDPDA